jgi:hypothetical protein
MNVTGLMFRAIKVITARIRPSSNKRACRPLHDHQGSPSSCTTGTMYRMANVVNWSGEVREEKKFFILSISSQ